MVLLNKTPHGGAAGLENRGAGDLEGASMVEMHSGQPCCDSVNADVHSVSNSGFCGG